jgi:hypothetical protein
MRTWIAAIAVCIVLASSCKMARLPYNAQQGKPYVALKDGRRIEATTVKPVSDFSLDSKLQADDTFFKLREVAFYSTGNETFANVGRKMMAQQVASGPINIYRYSYNTVSTHTTSTSGTYYTSTATTTEHQKHQTFYIQGGDNKPISTLTYRHLMPMLDMNSPAANLALRYKKSRTVARATGFGGIVLFVGGMIMGVSGKTSTANTGTVVGAVGLGSMVTAMGITLHNKPRLLKSVLLQDGFDGRERKRDRDR